MKLNNTTYFSLITNFICVIVIVILSILLFISNNNVKSIDSLESSDSTEIKNKEVICKKVNYTNSGMNVYFMIKISYDEKFCLIDFKTYDYNVFVTDNAYNSFLSRNTGNCVDNYSIDKSVICESKNLYDLDSFKDQWVVSFTDSLVGDGYECIY